MSELSEFQKREQAEQEAIDKAVKTTIRACDGKARLDEVLARVLNQHSCPSLYLEWVSDKFWALQMPALLNDLNRIYDELVKRNITEKNKTDFNDMDDRVFFFPNKESRVIVHTGQSFRHIYIWDNDRTPGFRRLHVRRFWDVYDPKPKDKLSREWADRDEREFKAAVEKQGLKQAILKARHLSDEYADDYKGNPYPYRYSLGHYKKNGFKVQYGDCRDKGYVLSWEEFKDKVDGSMYTHHIIKLITECFVPSILCALFGESDEAISDNETAREKDFDSWPAEEPKKKRAKKGAKKK